MVVPLLVASARTVERSADPALLAALLAAAPPTHDVDHLRATVLVATWRAGAVRFRAAALRAAAGLPATAGGRRARAAPGHAAGRRPRRAHAVTRGGGRARRRASGCCGASAASAGSAARGSRCRASRPAQPRPAWGATSGPTGSAGPCWPTSTGARSCGSTRTDVQQRAPAPHLPVPWDDEVTGWSAAGGDPRVVVVSRRHSYCGRRGAGGVVTGEQAGAPSCATSPERWTSSSGAGARPGPPRSPPGGAPRGCTPRCCTPSPAACRRGRGTRSTTSRSTST